MCRSWFDMNKYDAGSINVGAGTGAAEALAPKESPVPHVQPAETEWCPLYVLGRQWEGIGVCGDDAWLLLLLAVM